jgi:FixJ family two-component response regulator
VSANEPIVYLVDDDPAVLRGLLRLLRAWGYRARTFSSAQDFLDHRADNDETPDCLLLDVHMPGLSGIDLNARLNPPTLAAPTLPVVFLSGHLDASLQAEVLASGAVDYLQKPIEERDLLEAVRRAIEQRKQCNG